MLNFPRLISRYKNPDKRENPPSPSKRFNWKIEFAIGIFNIFYKFISSKTGEINRWTQTIAMFASAHGARRRCGVYRTHLR